MELGARETFGASIPVLRTVSAERLTSFLVEEETDYVVVDSVPRDTVGTSTLLILGTATCFFSLGLELSLDSRRGMRGMLRLSGRGRGVTTS